MKYTSTLQHFAAKNSTRTHRYVRFIIVITIVMGSIFAIYCIKASENVTNAYNRALQSSAAELRQTFKTYETTAAAKSFDSPDAPIEQYDADFLEAEKQITLVRKSVNMFATRYDHYPTAAYTSYVPLYAKSKSTSKDVAFMVSQSSSVLDSHSELIKTLRTIHNLEKSIEQNLNTANSITDFNLLIYQGAQFRDKSKLLREDISAVQSLKLPVEYQMYTTSLSKNANALADSLDALGNGLDAVFENAIYEATTTIEAISASYFNGDKELRFEANQNSSTLKQVSAITEKLDVFDSIVSKKTVK